MHVHLHPGKKVLCLQNVVLYSGSAKDREMIREHEFKYKTRVGGSQDRTKFNVLLASYEMVRKDKRVFQVDFCSAAQ